MRAPDRELAAAAALAGAAALAYETLWTRLLGLALGHEQLGVLAVLAGFFAGMALGAWLTHTRVGSLRRPARAFAGLQLLAAAFAIASPWLLTRFAAWLPSLLGVEPAPGRSLVAAGLILLPATAALGASLPILVVARRKLAADDARGLARLYTADTLGATLGVLVTIHLLLPRLGVVLAAVVCAALGLASAGAAMLAAERTDTDQPAPALEHPAIAASEDPDPGLLRERWLLYLAIALTGLLGLGLEVIGVRVLAQVYSGTIYSFADLLAVWLLGTALGAGVHARLSKLALGRRPATVLVGLLWLLGVTVACSAMLARAAPDLLDVLAPIDSAWSRRQAAELVVALVVLGPATVLMGACFAHLLALIAAPTPERASSARAIGAALSLNALAAAVAPYLFGIAVIGVTSYAETWSLIAWGYLLLAIAIAWLRRFSPRSLALLSVVGGLAVLAGGAGAGSLVLVDDEGEGWTVLERVEAPLGVVGVSETTAAPGSPERPLRRLRIDKHFRMGGALSIGERRMGHLPMILAGSEADSVLFLGLGTGATAGAALAYPVESVTAVELVPEIIDMLPYFDSVNAGLHRDPRAQILAADARRFLRADSHRYQLIVADLFHPERDGAGSLYAREHFEAARERLEPDGMFVQWLPLHQLDFATVRVIVATFTHVFEDAHAILALYNVSTPALGLIGSRSPITIELAAIERTLAQPDKLELYRELALLDPRDLLAGYLLDRPGLLALAGEAPINEDLHPRVELWAPRAQRDGSTGARNLELLLAIRRPWPDALVHDPDPDRLASYRRASEAFAQALEHYLRAEIAQLRGIARGQPIWAPEIVDLHLAAYLHEPDFLPARPRLFAAAAADPQLAERVLPAMLERTPDEPRVHRAWLSHLARIGDQARLHAAMTAAEPVLRER